MITNIERMKLIKILTEEISSEYISMELDEDNNRLRIFSIKREIPDNDNDLEGMDPINLLV